MRWYTNLFKKEKSTVLNMISNSGVNICYFCKQPAPNGLSLFDWPLICKECVIRVFTIKK